MCGVVQPAPHMLYTWVMIEITRDLKIDERELEFDFIRAAGPGGQNVNKVATAVQLRFNLDRSASLPGDVRMRLAELAGRRMNREGNLIILARRFRTQEKNREDAIHRLVELVRRALEQPRPRKKTRPTRSAQEKRLKGKKLRGEVKRARGSRSFD
jgi:ribosome-associated protein